jgi:hypothetical protein
MWLDQGAAAEGRHFLGTLDRRRVDVALSTILTLDELAGS